MTCIGILGEYISNKSQQDGWGSKTVQNLSNFLRKTEPNSKGFSPQNLWRMKQFYETFHRELNCLVALELKVGEFKPKYMGKMDFYLRALDKEVKKNHENPSTGIILCKTKDNNIVEISLNRSISPTIISQYETKLIDKELLRNKLNELFDSRLDKE